VRHAGEPDQARADLPGAAAAGQGELDGVWGVGAKTWARPASPIETPSSGRPTRRCAVRFAIRIAPAPSIARTAASRPSTDAREADAASRHASARRAADRRARRARPSRGRGRRCGGGRGRAASSRARRSAPTRFRDRLERALDPAAHGERECAACRARIAKRGGELGLELVVAKPDQRQGDRSGDRGGAGAPAQTPRSRVAAWVIVVNAQAGDQCLRRHENAVFALARRRRRDPRCDRPAADLVWQLPAQTQLTATLAIVLGSGALTLAVRGRVQRPLQTIAKPRRRAARARHSLRGRVRRRTDALGLVMAELGELAISCAPSAGVTRRPRQASRASSRASTRRSRDRRRRRDPDREKPHRTAPGPAGRSRRLVGDAGLAHVFAPDTPHTVELALPGGRGTWEVRRGLIGLSGMPHRLVVMTDVQPRPARRGAPGLQRLVRVLRSRKINNSLGPISSIAETLRTGSPSSPRRLRSRPYPRLESSSAAPPPFAVHEVIRPPRSPSRRRGSAGSTSPLDRAHRRPRNGCRIELAGGPRSSSPATPISFRPAPDQPRPHAIEASAETGGSVRITWSLAGDKRRDRRRGRRPRRDTRTLFVRSFTTSPRARASASSSRARSPRPHTAAWSSATEGRRGTEAVITLPAPLPAAQAS